MAGLLSFRKYDHLSGTAFIGYAALWSSFGATRIYFGALAKAPVTTFLPSTIVNNTFLLPNTMLAIENNTINIFATSYIEQSAIAGLIPYILLSFLLAFCSATVNYIMPFVFGAITFTLVFEAVGLVAGSWALVISGILELLILIFAIYGSAALLVKGLTQRLVLKGFGTPLFNVLLLGTASSASAQSIGQEKKKNTKYAEPMALGYFCDTVSSFIFVFYSFGYIKSFGLGATWVSIISAAQLFSSYYANLRQDCYHTTKFGLHATYWLIKAWEEFVASAQMENDYGREMMIGDWFFVMAALMFCAGSLNTDVLELIHNMLFALITISTIAQIPTQASYIFFGISCSLFTAASLYGTFARLINTIAEKSLIPVGPQPVSTEHITNTFKCHKLNEGQLGGQHPTQQTSDALFYILNGIASLSALDVSVTSTNDFLARTAAWILISGAVMQAYVSRLQFSSGRFGSVISSIYVAVWTTWTGFMLTGGVCLYENSNNTFLSGVHVMVINFF